MESIIKEIWHGNIIPQSDSRNNSAEMKQLMEYISRHHEDLLKGMTDEQKEIFEKFDDCWSEYASYAEEAIFNYAFRLGMRIAIETLTREYENAERGDRLRSSRSSMFFSKIRDNSGSEITVFQTAFAKLNIISRKRKKYSKSY